MSKTDLISWTKARYLFNIVKLFPGKCASQLAVLTSFSLGQVLSTLLSMERWGFLVYEDNSRIYAFGLSVDARQHH